MGISGCGKATIGKGISAELGIPFYDGDFFHPQENIGKMTAGIPLTDEDREGWLNQIGKVITDGLAKHKSGIIACSALKEIYRKKLLVDRAKVVFVYLKGSYDLIFNRVNSRADHYIKSSMLKSQFKALEEPDSIYTVNIDNKPNDK